MNFDGDRVICYAQTNFLSAVGEIDDHFVPGQCCAAAANWIDFDKHIIMVINSNRRLAKVIPVNHFIVESKIWIQTKTIVLYEKLWENTFMEHGLNGKIDIRWWWRQLACSASNPRRLMAKKKKRVNTQNKNYPSNALINEMTEIQRAPQRRPIESFEYGTWHYFITTIWMEKAKNKIFVNWTFLLLFRYGFHRWMWLHWYWSWSSLSRHPYRWWSSLPSWPS